MDDAQASVQLAALASVLRLKVFRFLLSQPEDGVRAGDIAAYFDIPPSTLSPHLAQLEAAGLVASRREQTNIYYTADLRGARALMIFLGKGFCNAHPALRDLWTDPKTAVGEDGFHQPSGGPSGTVTHLRRGKTMTDKLKNVLFLCRHNSARSIIAEAILAREGMGRFNSYSAGSETGKEPHPYALDVLKAHNHPIDKLRSKSWDEFAQVGAPKMDFVFTVCDITATEVCPVWPGQPMTAHWPLPDPSAVEGTEAERRFAFTDTYRMLSNRISIFVNLPHDRLDKLALQHRLDDIGQSARQPAKETA
jgi:protein-tyrosine-phosphatase/DNA-binding transcriptional ArsR family regulator